MRCARGEPIKDLRQAVADTLAAPLGFPPLVQAALVGDRVVLALESGLPQAATIVAQTIAQLTAAGVRAADIAVVLTSDAAEPDTGDPLAELPESLRDEVICQVHDPRDRESLSYLAASTDAVPIYLNRAIFDADLVISLGVLRLPDSLGYYGINSTLFPTFSDVASRGRFRSTKTDEPGERAKLRRQVDEVAWLLGSRFTIQVVPGVGDKVLHVLCGDAEAVLVAGTRLCQAAWSFAVPERVELVVAAIDGDTTQQTWENVGRALSAAAHVLADDGDVILCTELAERIGPALGHFIGAEDLHVALREIARERPADALPAVELARALDRGKVFLISQLRDDVVEDLGLLPLSADSVSHVAGRYGSCLVLANAQYAQARSSGDSALAARTVRESNS